MSIEWALPRRERRVALDERGIELHGGGACAVLLLHGLTGSPTELAYLAHWLRARARSDVSCPRLVNHGQPIGILARTSGRELVASARRAFLTAHRAACARGVPLVVGGLSLGADLALILAAEFGKEVAGVVCLSPTLFYDGWSVPWTHRLIPLVDYTPLKYFAYLREGPPFGLRDESLRAKIAERYGRMRVHDLAEAAKSGYAHFPVRLFCEMRHVIRACKEALPRVTSPLLVVQAKHDDVTGVRNAEFVLEHAASPKRELLLLEHSYHLVAADLERSSVAASVQQFCAAIAAELSVKASDARVAA